MGCRSGGNALPAALARPRPCMSVASATATPSTTRPDSKGTGVTGPAVASSCFARVMCATSAAPTHPIPLADVFVSLSIRTVCKALEAEFMEVAERQAKGRLKGGTIKTDVGIIYAVASPV